MRLGRFPTRHILLLFSWPFLGQTAALSSSHAVRQPSVHGPPATPFSCGPTTIIAVHNEVLLPTNPFTTDYAARAQFNTGESKGVVIKVGNVDHVGQDFIMAAENTRRSLGGISRVTQVFATCMVGDTFYVVAENKREFLPWDMLNQYPYQYQTFNDLIQDGRRHDSMLSYDNREMLARTYIQRAMDTVNLVHARSCIIGDLSSASFIHHEGEMILSATNQLMTFRQFGRRYNLGAEAVGAGGDVYSLAYMIVQLVARRVELPPTPGPEAAYEEWKDWIERVAPNMAADLVFVLASRVFAPVGDRANIQFLITMFSRSDIFLI